jgi:hypothetical protein
MSDIPRLIVPVDITPAMITACNVDDPQLTGDSPDPAVYSAGTTYASGARVSVLSDHMIYESAQAGNVSHDPTTDTTATWWTPVVATNRHRMFDTKSTSSTSRIGGIDLTLNVPQAFNALALINVVGAQVRVTRTDPTEGVIYDKTFVMQEPPSEADYYAYFFDPIVYRTLLIVDDLPTYVGADLRVQIITGEAAVASVGVLTLGRIKTLGDGVKMGARMGMDDYSKKARNAYGDYTWQVGEFSDKATVDITVPRAMVNQVTTLLKSVRAKPLVWILSGYYTGLVIYGPYRDWETAIELYDYSVINAFIEGLT